MQLHANRLQHFLELYRVPHAMIEHAPAFTSQVAAATMHVSGKQMAKTVVMQGQSESYLAVLPASHLIDLDRFAKIVGEPVRLATEDRIRDLFPDCELGSIPPFGRLYGLRTYVDVTLASQNEIVFPAGSHSDAARMSYRDFQGLTEPEVCSFAIKGRRQTHETISDTPKVH